MRVLPGIYRRSFRNHAGTSTVLVWECFATIRGQRRHRKFSILKYGEEEARRMAFEQRALWLAQGARTRGSNQYKERGAA